MSVCVCVCVSTATWVGGTFIIGTAETVYDPKLGLVWAVMPLAATLAFTVGKRVVLKGQFTTSCQLFILSRPLRSHPTKPQLLCVSSARWSVLRRADAGQEVRDHDGPFPHQVRGPTDGPPVCGSSDVRDHLGDVNAHQLG